MKASKRGSLVTFAALALAITVAPAVQLHAQGAKAKPSSKGSTTWSVQVVKVNSGDVNLEPSFQIAIYESLLTELTKTKRFKEVLRDRDRNATDTADLLILKTTVQKYTPGSETRRAVTTVTGATKLTVYSQLFTLDGQIIFERTVNGNVRFMGSNLHATQSLARNVAKAIKKSSLPAPVQTASAGSGEL